MTKSNSRAFVAGVMGPGDDATVEDIAAATTLGQTIASRGWVLLTGGRNAGVMAAASSAAADLGGFVLGILPNSHRHQIAPGVTVPVLTDLGNARNAVNVLSSDLVVAVAYTPGAGTLSEAALAVKSDRPLCILTDRDDMRTLFHTLPGNILITADINKCLQWMDEKAANIMGTRTLLTVHQKDQR